jgi:hypothetical protein
LKTVISRQVLLKNAHHTEKKKTSLTINWRRASCYLLVFKNTLMLKRVVRETWVIQLHRCTRANLFLCTPQMRAYGLWCYSDEVVQYACCNAQAS